LETEVLQMAENLCSTFTDLLTATDHHNQIDNEILKVLEGFEYEDEDLNSLKIELFLKTFDETKVEKRNSYIKFLLEYVQNDFHWAIGSHISKILAIMLHEMYPVEIGITKFAFENLTHEHLQVRLDCSSLANEILFITKKRAKILGSFKGEALKHYVERDDENYNRLIKSSFCWNRTTPEYFDKIRTGWLCWTDQLEFRVGSVKGDQYTDEESSESLLFISDLVTRKEFWAEYTNLALLVTDDNFNDDITGFINNLAIFKQDFADLIIDSLKDKMKNSDDLFAQKSSSEILSGLLYGSKAWETHNFDSLISRTIPIFLEAVNCSDVSRLEYWKIFMSILYFKRDPKRYLAVLKEIEKKFLSSDDIQSFFTQTRNIQMLLFAVSSTRCDLTFSQNVLLKLFEMSDSPYQEVREAIGYGIDLCLRNHSRPLNFENPSAEYFLENPPKGLMFGKSNQKTIEYLENIQEKNVPLPLGKNLFNSNIGKTMLTWFLNGICSFGKASMLPYYHQLVKYTLLISESSQPDLQEMANSLIKVFPHYLIPFEMVPEALGFFCKTLTEENSWHMKVKILSIIQSFYLKHLLLIESHDREMLVNVLLDICSFPHLEVFLINP
jgi:proteasome activator subunit 4